MSQNKKFQFKTSKTLNFKPEFKSLFNQNTLTENEEQKISKNKIKRFSSEKINLDKLNFKRQKTIGLPLVKEAQTSRLIRYKKYSPFTTLYAEINRTKREINSYIKEGREICNSIERRNKYDNHLYFSPNNTHTDKFKKKMFLTQSTFFQTPEVRKKNKSLFMNELNSTKKKKNLDIINTNKKKNKKKNKDIYNPYQINNPKEEDEHESRKSSISSKEKYETIIVKKGRMKTFVVSYIPKWHDKNKFINIKATKEIIESIDFQKNIFSDEIAVLLDNLNSYKKRYIMDEGLCYYFYNASLKNQRTINQLLEETIGLLIEISYLLLNDYSEEIDRFVANVQDRPNKIDDKLVENENEEFKINIKTFIECTSFIKICFDCYENIILYDKNFLIKKVNFKKIMQFFQRARLNAGQLTYFTESIFNNFNSDDRVVNRFLKEMKMYRMKNKNKKNIIKLNKNKNDSIDFYNYNGPIILKENQEQKKRKRLNVALDRDFSQTKRNYHPKHVDFNSPIVNELLKYATKQFTSQILSERIIQRFKQREREEDLNLDLE